MVHVGHGGMSVRANESNYLTVMMWLENSLSQPLNKAVLQMLLIAQVSSTTLVMSR